MNKSKVPFMYFMPDCDGKAGNIIRVHHIRLFFIKDFAHGPSHSKIVYVSNIPKSFVKK